MLIEWVLRGLHDRVVRRVDAVDEGGGRRTGVSTALGAARRRAIMNY